MSGLKKPTNTARDFCVIHTVHTVKIYASTNKCTLKNFWQILISYMFRHRSVILKGVFQVYGIKSQDVHLSKHRPHWNDCNIKILKYIKLIRMKFNVVILNIILLSTFVGWCINWSWYPIFGPIFKLWTSWMYISAVLNTCYISSLEYIISCRLLRIISKAAISFKISVYPSFQPSVCPSVYQSAWNISAPSGFFFMKFFIWGFFDNMWRKWRFN
jgi:hypothetical protein